jgi:hypothetical protein
VQNSVPIAKLSALIAPAWSARGSPAFIGTESAAAAAP